MEKASAAGADERPRRGGPRRMAVRIESDARRKSKEAAIDRRYRARAVPGPDVSPADPKTARRPSASVLVKGVLSTPGDLGSKPKAVSIESDARRKTKEAAINRRNRESVVEPPSRVVPGPDASPAGPKTARRPSASVHVKGVLSTPRDSGSKPKSDGAKRRNASVAPAKGAPPSPRGLGPRRKPIGTKRSTAPRVRFAPEVDWMSENPRGTRGGAGGGAEFNLAEAVGEVLFESDFAHDAAKELGSLARRIGGIVAG